MIDIQRRHAEVFRIRMGDRDGNRPRKLTDAIRITARSRQVVQAFVDVYGGAVSEWEQQWQAYLPTTELRVLVLPGQSVQQWWEFYRGSVCERRCDGYLEQKSGKRCMCPEDVYERAEDRDACSPMTRVNVLCPDVAVVGAGSLVTHGMIAAETLPQSVSVAESALSRGLMVPAVLRVVANTSGRNHFIFPQIEIIGTSMDALASGDANGHLSRVTDVPLALASGDDRAPVAEPARPPLTPVPAELPTGLGLSIAEQSAPPAPRPKRANAAPEIPPSGRQRRPDASPAADPEPGIIEPDEPPVDANAPGTITREQTKHLHAIFTEAQISSRDTKLAISRKLVGRDELESSKNLSKAEATSLIDALKRMSEGDDLAIVVAELLDRGDAADAEGGQS